MSDGYRGYGYLPEMGGYGFFNPWMKSPDVAGGINLLTNIIAQNQAMQQARQQQEWQRQMAEKEYALSERRIKTEEAAEKRLAQGQPEKPTALQEKIAFLIASGKTPQEAITLATLGRPNETETREERKFRQQQERDRAKVQTTINLYSKERNRLISLYDKTIAAYNAKDPADRTPAETMRINKMKQPITNIEQALSILEPMEGGIAESILTKEGHTTLDKFLASLNQVKSGEFFKQVPQQNIPKPPPGTPPGAKFEGYDKDGSQLWRFPDGSLNRWR